MCKCNLVHCITLLYSIGQKQATGPPTLRGCECREEGSWAILESIHQRSILAGCQRISEVLPSEGFIFTAWFWGHTLLRGMIRIALQPIGCPHETPPSLLHDRFRRHPNSPEAGYKYLVKFISCHLQRISHHDHQVPLLKKGCWSTRALSPRFQVPPSVLPRHLL